jgi:heat shock protein HslJ
MTMQPRWLLPTALALVLGTAAGCGGGGGGVEIGGAQGAGGPTGDWVLVEGEHDGAEVPIVEGHDITLGIEEERWGGTAACNSYGATVSVDGDRIGIGELAVTEMACEDDVMASESAYLAAFAAVERYDEQPGELTLEDDEQDVRLRYEEVPAEPDAAFEDTEWRLESLLEGSGPDGSVASVQGEATIVFWHDGLLVVEDGCRSMEATWEPTDDGVRIGDLGYADVACPPELEEQVEHVRAVLDGEVETALEGASLRLLAPDGRGLDLRAG